MIFIPFNYCYVCGRDIRTPVTGGFAPHVCLGSEQKYCTACGRPVAECGCFLIIGPERGAPTILPGAAA